MVTWARRHFLLAAGLGLMLLAAFGFTLSGVSAPPEGVEGYVFYGYAPALGRLYVTGINDSTHVQLFDLASGELMGSFTVNRMQLYSTVLRNETYFKASSDKLVAVYLGGGSGDSTAFYPSTDGGFSGREFIFMASNSTWTIGIGTPWYHNVSRILAVENSHIVVFDAGGRREELDVQAGSVKEITLTGGSLYRVVSTGRGMIGAPSSDGFDYLPSLTGGFVGRSFLSNLLPVIWGGDRESLYIIAHEEAEVSVYDLTRPGWAMSLTGPDIRKRLRAGESWYSSELKSGTPIRVESTGEVSVLMGKAGYGWGWHTGTPFASADIGLMGDDIAFAGAKPGQELKFVAPTGAVIFAAQDMTAEIDGTAIEMKKDQYLTLVTGEHSVRGTGPIVVEVLGRSTGWGSWGAYLINTRAFDVAYPPPPPPGGLTELLAYIGGGIVAAALLIGLVYARRRRKKA